METLDQVDQVKLRKVAELILLNQNDRPMTKYSDHSTYF